MPRNYLLAFSILAVALCAPLFSLPAYAAASSPCKAIDDAYKKQALRDAPQGQPDIHGRDDGSLRDDLWSRRRHDLQRCSQRGYERGGDGSISPAPQERG